MLFAGGKVERTRSRDVWKTGKGCKLWCCGMGDEAIGGVSVIVKQLYLI